MADTKIQRIKAGESTALQVKGGGWAWRESQYSGILVTSKEAQSSAVFLPDPILQAMGYTYKTVKGEDERR